MEKQGQFQWYRGPVMMMSVSRHERGRMAMDQMVWGESNLKQQMSAEGSLRGRKSQAAYGGEGEGLVLCYEMSPVV